MARRSWQPVEFAVVGLGAALVVFFTGAAVVLAVNSDAPTAFWAAGGAIAGGLLGLLVPPPVSNTAPDTGKLATQVAGELTHAAAVRAAQAAATGVPPDQRQGATAAIAEMSGAGVGMLAALEQNVPQNATLGMAAYAAATGAAEYHQTAANAAAAALAQANGAVQQAQAEQPPVQANINQATAAATAATGRSAVLAAAARGANTAKLSATGSGVTTAATAVPLGSPQGAAWGLLSAFVVLLAIAIALAGGLIIPPKQFGPSGIENLTKTVTALASAAGTGLIGLFAPTSSRNSKTAPSSS